MAQKITKPATPVKTATTRSSAVKSDAPVHFIFDKGNYRLLIISAVVVALGFIIAPLVVLGGFALGFVAIFKKPEAKA